MAARKRGTLSARIPATDFLEVLHRAAHYLPAFNKRILTSEILLHALLQSPDSGAYRILRRLADERGIRWTAFADDVERTARSRLAPDVAFDFKTDTQQRVPLSDDVLFLIDEGYSLAQSRHETRCTTEHILVFFPSPKVSASSLLVSAGITTAAVRDMLSDPTTSAHAMARDHVALFQQQAQPPVFPRDTLRSKLITSLSMAQRRHVILTGPNGVGKRSLAYALAQAIAADEGPSGLRCLVEMSEQALLDDAATTVRAALRQAQGGILFVPNIARFFGGFRAEFPEAAGAEIQKAFYDDQVVILGTVTPTRFDERLKHSAAISEHASVLTVPPATPDETEAILETLRPRFEADYSLVLDPVGIKEATRLAARYLTEEPLPSSAVHLLHRACAMRLTSADRQAETPAKLSAEDVLRAASVLTGIPVTSMGAEERQRYVHMVDHLKERIIGQDEAVLTLSRAVRMARVGLKDPKRPIGSFMFLGPTGVGKSELAKALAEFMFSTESALIVLDMSEYMDASSINRLIGSPPGYIGSEAGGQLTNAVKARPYSVVLFDEVEKADIKVFDLLLQVMDEGRLTSAQGEVVSFSECVVLMTSNIGSRHLANPALTAEEARDLADEELKVHFRPEFLNRLDDIVFFHPLNQTHLRLILDLMLRKEMSLLAAQQLSLQLSDDAKTWLLSQNEHPEWGARPLRRIIQEHIRAPLSDFLLHENPQSGAQIHIDVDTNGLVFQPTKVI